MTREPNPYRATNDVESQEQAQESQPKPRWKVLAIPVALIGGNVVAMVAIATLMTYGGWLSLAFLGLVIAAFVAAIVRQVIKASGRRDSRLG